MKNRWSNFVLLIGVIGLISFVSAETVFAVPAAPFDNIFTQSDGSEFVARQWGDEWQHGWETRAGYTILFDEVSQNWTYAQKDVSGHLAPSDRVVGQFNPEEVLQRHIRPVKVIPQGVNQPNLVQGGITGINYAPAPPFAHLPVILIDYTDAFSSYLPGDFNNMLFGNGVMSMRDYYNEVSYGQFSLTGVVDGWRNASSTHDNYGLNVICNNIPVFGQTFVTDQFAASLVAEAVNQADPSINFDNYDDDGDCYVDNVAVVHQGTGEEAGLNANDIWSHSWYLSSAYYCGDGPGAITTNDPCSSGSGNVIVDKYTIQPEILMSNIMITVGVFAHEYGHALGLPDLYDTDGSSEGIGEWGVMGSGSWNQVAIPGDTPAHMSPWSKYYLGWIVPTQIITPLINEPIYEVSANPDVYQLLPGGPFTAGGEYFLVENRQWSGFDAGLPSEGLLIWHIDETMTNNKNECIPPASCEGNYLVSVEQADGLFQLEQNISNRGDAGDPFSSSTSTEFTPTTWPNSNYWDNSVSNVYVTNISTSGPIMTADLSLTQPLNFGSLAHNSTDPLTVVFGNPPQSVTWTASASGGSGSYEYRFWMYGPETGNTWQIAQNWGPSDQFSWLVDDQDAGQTTVSVVIRDLGTGEVVSGTYNNFQVNVIYSPLVFGSLGHNSVDPLNVLFGAPASPVQWTASATGGSGQYEYRFWMVGPETGGAWSIVQPYGPSSQYNWMVDDTDAGQTTVTVIIRDLVTGSVVSGTYSNFQVNVTYPPLVFGGLGHNSIDPLSVVFGAPSSTVQWTASATGGSGQYEYRFWMVGPETGGAWTIVQPYSGSNQYNWTVDDTDAGQTTVTVIIRDLVTGSVVSGTYSNFQVNVTYPQLVFTGLGHNSTDPLVRSSGSPSSTVQWTASATGGSGQYEYRFWMVGPETGGAWTIVQPYSGSNQYNWTVDDTDAGQTTVTVIIRDLVTGAMVNGTYSNFTVQVQ